MLFACRYKRADAISFSICTFDRQLRKKNRILLGHNNMIMREGVPYRLVAFFNQLHQVTLLYVLCDKVGIIFVSANTHQLHDIRMSHSPTMICVSKKERIIIPYLYNCDRLT